MQTDQFSPEWIFIATCNLSLIFETGQIHSKVLGITFQGERLESGHLCVDLLAKECLSALKEAKESAMDVSAVATRGPRYKREEMDQQETEHREVG